MSNRAWRRRRSPFWYRQNGQWSRRDRRGTITLAEFVASLETKMATYLALLDSPEYTNPDNYELVK